MRFKNILFTSLFVSALNITHAQSVDDALLFSQELNSGTARFKGLGNAKTALGGDISSVTGNPAGLGFFGQSDISITAAYSNTGNKSSYFGTNTTKNKGRFAIDHAGAVFHFPKNEGYHGWQNFNVGFSYENTNNFNNHVRYEGINPNNTIVSAYSDEIAFYGGQDFANDLRNMNLVEQFDRTDGTTDYFPIPYESGNKTQVSNVVTSGFSNKSAIAFGGNYNNKLYIGGTVGLTNFRYEHTVQFSEYGWTKIADHISPDNPNSEFLDPTKEKNKFVDKNYELFDDYYQYTEGSGVDFKIGAIFKPAVDWNIGATITSPTWYTIDDYYDRKIQVDYYEDEQATTSFSSFEKIYPLNPSTYTYRQITPWKFNLGLSKFFSRGFVSADAEFVDYSTTKRRVLNGADPSSEDVWDKEVKDAYQSVVNFRVGGEFLFTNAISGRAGFNYYGNPYKNADNTQYSGSLGLGAKLTNTLYLDLAVVHLVNDYKVSPYTIIDETFWNTTTPTADIKHQRTNVVLTFGAKF
ncbi:OmpP1/FadL family transporter [Sphingobacterium sp. LRF_L2]|uniref:OmpP1/FadL family transporter n=1 Tax=Sphingobacterium sp. LRF_L2 TaxID=3369421 RepID=UPI003F60D6DD